MENKFAVMVLNDGESWTALDGCEILLISESALNELEEDVPIYAIESKDIYFSLKLHAPEY